jgi:hypothetical protein
LTLRRAVMLVGPLVALAGCGNSRTPVPNLLAPAAPNGFRTLTFPADGVRLRAPLDWAVGQGRGSLVTTLSSGTAVVALWRYPRSSPLPRGTSSLAAARRRLISQARALDPGLHLIRSKISRIGGVPVVELDAFEQIDGHARRVRSSHLFEAHAELVLDEYAPPDLFHAVDHSVFSPVKRSLLVIRTAA